MITEEERIKTKQGIIEERKKFLKQVIDASARYERLLSDKDFQNVLEDLQKVVDIHNREIAILVKNLCDESNFFKRMRVESILRIHQVRKDQLLEALVYPEKLVHEARLAREELKQIRTEENQNGTNPND